MENENVNEVVSEETKKEKRKEFLKKFGKVAVKVGIIALTFIGGVISGLAIGSNNSKNIGCESNLDIPFTGNTENNFGEEEANIEELEDENIE